MRIAHPRGSLARNKEIGRLIGQHGRLDVEQGDVDVLALSRRPGMQQGRHDGV